MDLQVVVQMRGFPPPTPTLYSWVFEHLGPTRGASLEDVMKLLGSEALLEEVYPWGWALRT